MFNEIPKARPDAILALMAEFRADQRSDKLDLGVGVYKDEQGATPIMAAVKQAEQQILSTQQTKTYVGPAGDAEYCNVMCNLIFGDTLDTTRTRALQAPGGSGALKVLADMLHQINPDARTWIPDPTWPNHLPMLTQAGHDLQTYRYYDNDSGMVDFDGMLADLEQARPGDLLVLHGCCHNPTGADLDREQWQQVAQLCASCELMPYVDLAYLGFGQGLEEDAWSVRHLASVVPEMVIAASCSKNFALYRERVGSAIIVARDKDGADRALAKLSSVVRANYSMPPDHGSAVVKAILTDEQLASTWRSELDSMCSRMQRLRHSFADALRKRSNSDNFDYIARQHGMFTRLPLSTAQIERLRDESGIYIVGDGRVNIAGLPDQALDELAEKIVEVL